MKRKMKITISALAVMFVAAIAVAIASFSFAGNGNGDDALSEDLLLADASGSVSEKTIIDYIIENSHSTDQDIDKMYHIVEITSNNASTLQTYVGSQGFRNYVIDGNKTIEQLMAEGCVDYTPYPANVKDENSLKAISNADLIYVSNDGSKKFSKENDISEELYDVLHEYAVGSFKPLIIDSPTATVIDNDDSKSMADLAKNVFGPNEKYYYTFKWNSGMTASDYLSHASGSLYLGINGKTQLNNGVWKNVYDSEIQLDETGNIITTPVPAEQKLAKVLSVGVNETAYQKTTDILAGNTELLPGTNLYQIVTAEDGTKSVQTDTSTGKKVFYKMEDNSIFRTYGYNARADKHPNYIENDRVTLADLAQIDLDEYDMIILENTCNVASVSSDIYKKLASAMYGKLHIVYDSAMGTATADNKTNITDGEKRDTKYNVLFFSVSTSDYVAKYDNIMVTNRNDFSLITTSASASTAKVIADLINASKYRGIGGSSSAASMFTVLELQPCYPIDTTLAESRGGNTESGYYKGKYYVSPADVVNGKTKDEIPEGTEYYNWELSKAKLSDALGIPYNKINLVQMSTEEFAGDKTEILGTYDMIYIGGNISAIRDNAKFFMQSYPQSIGGQWGGGYNNNPKGFEEALARLPIYCMYSHNGDLVEVKGTANENLKSDNLTAKVRKDNQDQSTMTLLNGNDITYNRYLALKSYIESGMPVVVSKQLSQAFTIAKDKNYLQNTLDPDCNMYKVLQACDAQKSKTSENPTVVFDFDQSAVVDIYSDGTLGESQSGFVSVFASQKGSTSDKDPSSPKVNGTKELLAQVYNASHKKPKLVIKKMPKAYNRFDSDTLLTSRTLTFEYDVVNCSDYTVSLYIDDDGNSKFNKDKSGKEFMTSSNTGKLEYTCPTSFFGQVYWLLEVVDNDTGVAVSQTGFSYIKNADGNKQQVSILQIIPENGGTSTGNDSLYFCPVCQRSTKVLNYNPLFNQDISRYGKAQEYHNCYEEVKDGKMVVQQWIWNPNTYTNDVVNTEVAYIGRHEHQFGIATYDSNRKLAGDQSGKGTDEVYSNVASEIQNLYDFDIDIVTSRELEEMSDQVRKAYTNKINGETITDTALTLADMVDEVKQGPAPDAPGSEDFTELLEEKFKLANLTTGTTSEKINQLEEEDIQVLYVQKKKCDFAALASDYKVKYDENKKLADEKKEDLDAALEVMINKGSKPNVANQLSYENWIKELKQIRNSGYYYDLYSMSSRVLLHNDVSSFYGVDLNTLVSDYYKANDIKLQYKDLYNLYTRLAGGTNWIEACYSSVLFGPSESFNYDDINTETALDDLETYIKNGNQVVLFHDTLTPATDLGAVKLTNRLRSYFGMDRYHMQSTAEASSGSTNGSNPIVTASDSAYVKYTSTDNDKYFMTNLSFKPRNNEERYSSWSNDTGLPADKYLTRVAYTDTQNLGDNAVKAKYAMPYRYATINYADQTAKIQDTQFDFGSRGSGFGTNRASQNNEGLVTTFPFTISKELNIGPTHAQSYAVDLEDDDMTVWYSLAAAYNDPADSSIFAASPRDAMDSYYLYSYKNVFYCGAGHSDITGIGKDNNDERYLFINIICNSVRLSVNQPRINIYDYKTEENEIIKRKEDGSYETKVDEDTAYPEFSMKVTLDTSAKISKVRIYYDLDYLTNSSNEYTEDSNHIMVANWNVSNVQSGKRRDIWRYDSDLIPLRAKMENGQPVMNGKDYVWETEKYTGADGKESDQVMTRLKLQPSYFAPYNNEYTYLVIQVTDDAGNTVYQRIKIKLKPHLFDLT